MSRTVNSVTLLGSLGRDAEQKSTSGGNYVTTFSLATERRWKDQQSGDFKTETDWHSVVLWGMPSMAQFLVKGKQVYVGGRLQTRSFEKDGVKQYRTEVVADQVILLGGGRDS